MASLGHSPLSVMLSEIGRLVEDPSTALKTTTKEALNRAYDGVVAQYEWPQLALTDETGLRKRDDTPKTLVSGEAEFPLPVDAAQIRGLFYQDGSGEQIEVVSLPSMYQMLAGDTTRTGRPLVAAIIGTTPQHRRLAASGNLTAICPDSDENDGLLSPVIEYQVAAGMSGQQTRLPLIGVFSVGVTIMPAAAAGYPISKVHLPDAWQGGFRVTDSSGNVLVDIRAVVEPQLATASPTPRTYANTLLRAMPTADADYGLTVACQRRPQALDADGDVPEIPVSTYLVEKVAAEILRQKGEMDKAQFHEAEAATYLARLIRQASPGAQSPQPNRPNFALATGFPTFRHWH